MKENLRRSVLGAIICIALILVSGVRIYPQDLRGQALRLHRDVLTIDTHCDTPLRMANAGWDISVRHAGGGRGSGKIDLPRMADGNLDAEFFAVFVGQRPRTAENYASARARADALLALIHRMCIDRSDQVALSTRAADAEQNAGRGKVSIYIGLENGFPLAEDLGAIKGYYDRGVRYITLCHSANNQLCDSSTDPRGPEHHGLSEFGEKVVQEMNRLGMMIDISHASDESFYDVLRLSSVPVIASHSCCRALCAHPRNLSDEMLTALAQKGGVMQLCLLSEYVKTIPADSQRIAALKAIEEKFGDWESVQDDSVRQAMRKAYEAIEMKYPRQKATVRDLVDHIDHVVQLVGVDYVGIGSDFDGGGGVSGCDEVSELPNITLELLQRGYSEKDIRKIWSENFLRVFHRVEEEASARPTD